MRFLLTLGAIALTAIAIAAPQAQAATTCTWGGTVLAPTGTFSITPGLTNSPATEPLDFVARGELAGGGVCHGTMTWTGVITAGSTCALATFDGRVRGLKGVSRFHGIGNLDVPSQLYDSAGRLVGQENAEVITPANQPHFLDCNTPQGFTGGWPAMFSSVVVLF